MLTEKMKGIQEKTFVELSDIKRLRAVRTQIGQEEQNVYIFYTLTLSRGCISTKDIQDHPNTEWENHRHVPTSLNQQKVR